MILEWADDDIEELRRRYVGADEDFDKLERYLRAAWTRVDWDNFGRSRLFITWDAYFSREKLIAK